MAPLSLFDKPVIDVFWNVEECPNWDRRYHGIGAVHDIFVYTDTQPTPELMDGLPPILTKRDKDNIAITIAHDILRWARNSPDPSISTLMLISDNLSEETLTTCLALKVRGYSFLLFNSDESSVEDASVEYLCTRLLEIQKNSLT